MIRTCPIYSYTKTPLLILLIVLRVFWEGINLRAQVTSPTQADISKWESERTKNAITLIDIPAATDDQLYILPADFDQFLKKQSPESQKTLRDFMADFSRENPIIFQLNHVFVASNLFTEGNFYQPTCNEADLPKGLKLLVSKIYQQIQKDNSQLVNWNLEIPVLPSHPDSEDLLQQAWREPMRLGEEIAKTKDFEAALGTIPPDIQALFTSQIDDLKSDIQFDLPPDFRSAISNDLRGVAHTQADLGSRKIIVSPSLIRTLYQFSVFMVPWQFDPTNLLSRHLDAAGQRLFAAKMDELTERLTFVVLHECGHVILGDAKSISGNEEECDVWALSRLRKYYPQADSSHLTILGYLLPINERLTGLINQEIDDDRVRMQILSRMKLLIRCCKTCSSCKPEGESFDCYLKQMDAIANGLPEEKSASSPSINQETILQFSTNKNDFIREIGLALIPHQTNVNTDLKDVVKKAFSDKSPSVVKRAIAVARAINLSPPDFWVEIARNMASDDKQIVRHGITRLFELWSSTSTDPDPESAQAHMAEKVIELYDSASGLGKDSIARSVKSKPLLRSLVIDQCEALKNRWPNACQDLKKRIDYVTAP